ncbi:DUF4231 domain-containing protein [Dictyobacter aurantiacus]|uniref:SMODS and SLOG-associating 2TM effector domain-containing protein n=1 Tax=Dictyobacter aurantiacus TaxID=1936993 RepID=A0A401ZJI9_9CHLR|nr:DUF4231 domain-containing protein [Dictyobacter aurantiacus]GCE07027.1 hypothetical protein KDAU_43560 [Dictyobacter aurantiacus]
MEKEQKTTPYQQGDTRFISLLQELTHIKETYAVRQLQWYKQHTPQAKYYFRFSSALIIILSVSIPFLATLDGPWRTTVLPIIALLIAGLTGLSAFFRWEDSWKGYMHAQMTLEHLLWLWELKIAEARHEPDAQKGMEIARQATEQLINETRGTIHSEAEEYFKRVQLPQTTKS